MTLASICSIRLTVHDCREKEIERERETERGTECMPIIVPTEANQP